MTSFKATFAALAVATTAAIAAPITFTGSTFESRQGNNQSFSDTYQYQANFASLPAGGAGYGTAALPAGNWNPPFFPASNQGLVSGGSATDIAFHFQVNFTSVAGVLSGNMAPDFGFGGGVLLDGVEVAFNPNDMWWGGNWGANSQIFSFTSTLAAGSHSIDIYGQEGCCDGFTGFDASFTPTPDNGATLALLGFGLAGVTLARRSFKA